MSLWVIRILAFVFVVLLWHSLGYFGKLEGTSFSSPLAAVDQLLINPIDYLVNAAFSIVRLSLGLFIGLSLGVVLGSLTGMSRRMDAGIGTFISILAPVPIIVWLPVAIALVDSQQWQKVFLIAIPAMLIASLAAHQQVKGTLKRYTPLLRIYQKRWDDIFLVIVLPSAVLAAIGTLRLSLYLGWISLFLVEYSQSTNNPGLGYVIADARSLGNEERFTAGLLTLITVSYLVDRFLLFILGVSSNPETSASWRRS